MKKFICSAALTLALCAALVLPACSKKENYSETFIGYLSQNSFSSENSAVRAFLKEQLSGETADCTLNGYRSYGSLSQTELEKLGLDEKFESADKMTVNYDNGNSENRKATVYVLKSASGYRYYSPLPKSGEAVTLSYYDSMLSNKDYSNCTVTTTYSGHFYSIESTYLQVFKFADTKAYFKQTIPTMKVDFYMEQTAGGFEYYSKLPFLGDNGYYTEEEINKKVKEKYGSDYYFEGYVLRKGGKEYPLDSFSSISELSSFIYAANYDSSYFVKTDYGFCMPFEKFKEAVYSLSGMLGEDSDEIVFEINKHIASLNIKYYVSDGRLSKIDYVVQAIVSDDPKDLVSVEMHSKFTDFGTTEVNLPR